MSEVGSGWRPRELRGDADFAEGLGLGRPEAGPEPSGTGRSSTKSGVEESLT